VAGALGVPAHPSVQAAVDDGVAIDAADVRTPHATHADAACDAVGRGWHVLVEKPLATTLADGERIWRAAATAGRVAAVAENYPHIRAVRAPGTRSAPGRWGTCSRCVPPARSRWMGCGCGTAGAATAARPRDSCWAREPTTPACCGSSVARSPRSRPRPARLPPRPRLGAGGWTRSCLTVRFASGLAAQSLYSWTAFPLIAEAEGTVAGSRGRIEIRVSYDTDEGGAVLWNEQSPDGRAISPAENYYDSHRSIVEDWVAAIRSGGTPLVSVDDGLADLAVVLAAGRSLEDGGCPAEL
jgi:predicted dehydrogenase